MYVLRNNEAHSRNHCWSGKSISITYSDCVFVAYVIQHAMCMCHIVIYGLPDCKIFFHISQTARFSKKKVIEHKMCVLIFSAILCETFIIISGTEWDMI
jgi:hypothetical protein